jgi:hypothetical protein
MRDYKKVLPTLTVELKTADNVVSCGYIVAGIILILEKKVGAP